MSSSPETAVPAGWQDIYRPVGDLVTREIAGETLLVPIRGNLADMQRIFSLNSVAACIWQHLDGRQSLGDARRTVTERFAVTEQEAGDDILSFLREVIDAGLVERVGP
jgi:hypothetical protein